MMEKLESVVGEWESDERVGKVGEFERVGESESGREWETTIGEVITKTQQIQNLFD